MATNDKDEKATRQSAPTMRESASEPPRSSAGAYQEGSVKSVGGGPSGTDTDDRTGQAGTPPGVPRATEPEGNRDAFTSSEVAEESAGAPGRPERTRG